MGVDDMFQHIFLTGGGKAADFALDELLAALGRDLQQHALRIVEEEIGDVLKLIGVTVLLELADDRSQRLGLGQHLDLGVQRLEPLGKTRLTLKRLLRKRLAGGILSIPAPLARTAVRRHVVGGAHAPHRYARILFRPIRGEIKRSQRTEINRYFFFLFHIV